MKYIKSNGTSVLKVKHPFFIYRITSANILIDKLISGKYTKPKHNSILQLHILHVMYIKKHCVSKVKTCNYQRSCKHIFYIFVIRLMMAIVTN